MVAAFISFNLRSAFKEHRVELKQIYKKRTHAVNWKPDAIRCEFISLRVQQLHT